VAHSLNQSVPVIAIDGPGGAGKGTVSHELASRLGWHLLDSGSLYRVTAYIADERGISPEDSKAVSEVARTLNVRFEQNGPDIHIILEDNDVSNLIIKEEVGKMASIVAADPAVRRALIDRQRAFARPPGLVADGRDMGTVVFSDARLKIFLTASVEERARRRYKQLKDKGMGVNLPALSRDMKERDRRDSERLVAPLRAADDARVLDSTELAIPEVVDLVISWANEVFPL
jgi:cytidylate kinase